VGFGFVLPGEVLSFTVYLETLKLASLERKLCLLTLTFAFSFWCLGQVVQVYPDCYKDVKDSRGKMKSWKKGAWETGRYRNVFRDAGYSQTDIDAKLEPYSDGYFGPYFDGLLYLFSLMHLSGNYRIITPGLK
jgi:hypothetical protein